VSWIVLVVAGLLETVWALAMKASDGFSKPAPTVVFVVALAVSMVLLAIALKELPVGTAYAVWVGIGAVGTAVAGMLWLGDAAAVGRMIPIGLIAVGVVWLALAE
jgi:quaternary ammonium compound-resistance protein SugE